MRILGFSKKWSKLNGDTFTTFRFPRKDKDWQTGEHVQIVFKPRIKEREVLGEAYILSKDKRWVRDISTKEAIIDGFDLSFEAKVWFMDTYGERVDEEPMNKLTLKWIRRF